MVEHRVERAGLGTELPPVGPRQGGPVGPGLEVDHPGARQVQLQVPAQPADQVGHPADPCGVRVGAQMRGEVQPGAPDPGGVGPHHDAPHRVLLVGHGRRPSGREHLHLGHLGLGEQLDVEGDLLQRAGDESEGGAHLEPRESVRRGRTFA